MYNELHAVPCVTLTLRSCPACGRTLGRGSVYCSNACRQLAHRRRHDSPALPMPLSRSPANVFECPSCENGMLGEQRCSDCNVFCRRIGPGGDCPHCGEIVAVIDLVAQQVMQATNNGPSNQHTDA